MHHMKFFGDLVSLLMLAKGSVAAEITLYHDSNCQNVFYQDNVLSATCSSPSQGFSSMIINTCDEGDSEIIVYSQNYCGGSLGTSYKCGDWVGKCAGFGTCNAIYNQV